MRNDADQTLLNVAAWEHRSIANGPGVRFVLWLQGCPLRCEGCFNPDFLPFVPKRAMSVEAVADMIVATAGIEGVTFSGGDPMAQPRGLYYLSRRLRAEGLTVISYTGYRLEDLRISRNPWIAKFLTCIDLLVDGPFEQERQGNLPMRGSDNQRLHFLTNAYAHLRGQMETPGHSVEIVVGSDTMVGTGILSPIFFEKLRQVLQEGPADDLS